MPITDWLTAGIAKLMSSNLTVPHKPAEVALQTVVVLILVLATRFTHGQPKQVTWLLTVWFSALMEDFGDPSPQTLDPFPALHHTVDLLTRAGALETWQPQLHLGM